MRDEDQDGWTDQPDALAALLRAAGRRPEPPAVDRERVRAASYDAWQRALAVRRRRRMSWGLAIAASILGAIGLAVWLPGVPTASPHVADLALALGGVEVFDSESGRWVPPKERMPLPTGSRLRTGADALLSLQLADGSVLRAASQTEFVLSAQRRIELLHGALYVHNLGVRHLDVVTDLGTVSDIGTQFEVLLRDGRLRTRVRSGSVRLERDGDVAVECLAGEELSLKGTNMPVRRAFAPDDAYWEWMAALARPPEIEGLPLKNFLAWAASELGRQLRFASPEIEARARAMQLHGSLDDLTPLQALDVVLAGTSLSYVLPDDGSILVTKRGPPE